MARKVVTSVTLTQDQHDRLGAQAAREGRSRSSMMGALVERYLAEVARVSPGALDEPAPVLRRKWPCPCGVPETAFCVKCDRA